MATRALVRRNAYVDSVTLLQVTAEVSALTGVAEAALVMATELNRELLKDSGLLVGDADGAGANDLVIAVRASDDAAAANALEQAEALLARRRTTTGKQERQTRRSIRSAHRADPEARLAVISVPGQYAAAEARQALSDGLHVFLFSDNVSIEDEIDLKQLGRQKGLLVMGPDCGTSILGGVGLGFANVVRRGAIGVIGASGTGIQEVTSLVHQAGQGISHAIGTGGRDLYAEVGGITTLQAIVLLKDDLQTQTIVLVSKPADAQVAAQVLSKLAETGKRAIAHLQGVRVVARSEVMVAANLAEAARLATSQTRETTDAAGASPSLREPQRQVRGLFCGGTLCQEAATALGNSAAHQFIDFGDDQYTRGRAHPMIDPTLRNQAIVEAGSDQQVAVILLDVILGLAAHSDPAGAAAPAIGEAISAARTSGRELAVLAHIVGTDRDPQDLARQEHTLLSAGVKLFKSNVDAANAAARIVSAVPVS